MTLSVLGRSKLSVVPASRRRVLLVPRVGRRVVARVRLPVALGVASVPRGVAWVVACPALLLGLAALSAVSVVACLVRRRVSGVRHVPFLARLAA